MRLKRNTGRGLAIGLLLGICIMVIPSCGGKAYFGPSFNGTYTGTSTPSTGSAYPDTIIISPRSLSSILNVQRTFHTGIHYYTFGLNGQTAGYNLLVPDTTIAFSPPPTQYWGKGTLSDSVLTLHDYFVYLGGDTGTSIFVGTRH